MGSMREVQRRDTEARVLATAGELFRTSGFTVTTVRDIAAAAEVSVGTVISVGDKNALLIASFDQRIREIHQTRANSSTPSIGGLVERISALFDPFAELFTTDPDLARIYASVLVAGETESSTFTELAETLTCEIETVLRDAFTNDARPLAEGIYFAYIGRLFTWPPKDDHNPDQLKQGLKHIVAAICEAKEFHA